jgi:hypothetical protein
LKEPIAHPITKEFDQGLTWKEVLEMLMLILPTHSAQVSQRIQSSIQDDDWNKILWYNKSRKTSRICPTCLRLYNVGDDLPPHVRGGFTAEDLTGFDSVSLLAVQQREQELSGFCMLLFLEIENSNLDIKCRFSYMFYCRCMASSRTNWYMGICGRGGLEQGS